MYSHVNSISVPIFRITNYMQGTSPITSNFLRGRRKISISDRGYEPQILLRILLQTPRLYGWILNGRGNACREMSRAIITMKYVYNWLVFAVVLLELSRDANRDFCARAQADTAL